MKKLGFVQVLEEGIEDARAESEASKSLSGH